MRAIGFPELIVIAFAAIVLVASILVIAWLFAKLVSRSKAPSTICPHCHQPTAANGRFCSNCGHPAEVTWPARP